MALKALKDHLDPGGDRWDPVQHRVQCAIVFLKLFRQLISYRSCMEHLLHLAAGHVLSHITLAHKARINDENDETSAGTATSNECSANISQGLCKLLGLIKQVCVIHRICSIH